MIKVKNLFLLLCCLLYRFFRGKATSLPSSIERIIVFRSKPHIGDMVYITPIFENMKRAFPKSGITLIGSSRVLEVVEHNPSIEKTIDYKNGFFKTLMKIRKENWDFGCLINPGSVEGLAL